MFKTIQNIKKRKCEPPKNKRESSSSSSDYQRFQLRHLSVQPVDERPVLVLPNRRALKLVVDSIVTKHQNTVDVLFLATELNTILKYMISSPLTTTSATISSNTGSTSASGSASAQSTMVCFLEELDVLDDSERNKRPINAINNMILLDDASSSRRTATRDLLIATSFSLIKLNVANCESQTNYFSCLSGLDPYCVWDSRAQKCLLIFNTNETRSSASASDRRSIGLNIKQNPYLHQHPINTCPITNIPSNHLKKKRIPILK